MTAAEVIGKGLYGLNFAARILQLHPSTLRSWARGREFVYRGKRFHTKPRWEAEHGEEAGVLGFLDLVEARIIREFRTRGVKWKTIVAAGEETKRILGVDHPFATRKLKTNGQRIFLHVGEGTKDEAMIEVASSQIVFGEFITPFLLELDFDEYDLANRWWPIGRDREVIVDPARSFGKPIVKTAGVPTAVLARAVAVEGSSERVARWYQVTEKEVEDAVYYERTLAAA